MMPTSDQKESAVAFHEFMLETKEKLLPTAERDEWATWLNNCPSDWKIFITILVMMLTMKSKDEQVNEVTHKLRTNCGVTNPRSIMFFRGESSPNREVLQSKIARHFKTGIGFLKADYIVELAMVCLVEGRSPQDSLEVRALHGVGPKIYHVTMWEAFSEITVSVVYFIVLLIHFFSLFFSVDFFLLTRNPH